MSRVHTGDVLPCFTYRRAKKEDELGGSGGGGGGVLFLHNNDDEFKYVKGNAVYVLSLHGAQHS